jgi:hypothetical protein
VAVGTHQWSRGAYQIADGLRLPVGSIERRHGYQRILLPLWTRPKNRTTF